MTGLDGLPVSLLADVVVDGNNLAMFAPDKRFTVASLTPQVMQGHSVLVDGDTETRGALLKAVKAGLLRRVRRGRAVANLGAVTSLEGEAQDTGKAVFHSAHEMAEQTGVDVFTGETTTEQLKDGNFGRRRSLGARELGEVFLPIEIGRGGGQGHHIEADRRVSGTVRWVEGNCRGPTYDACKQCADGKGRSRVVSCRRKVDRENSREEERQLELAFAEWS